MSVEVPDFPSPVSAEPRFLDFGVRLDSGPAADGPRIGRVGNRWAIDVTIRAPMEPRRQWPTGARVWLERLRQARGPGAILKWHPQRLQVGAPGAPVIAVASAANVEVLQVSGFRPGYVLREGQFFNLISAGRHHLHSSREDVRAAADGTLEIPCGPLLRVAPQVGDVIRMDPVIEGRVIGDFQSWSQDPSAVIDVSFSIEEFGVFADVVA